MKRAHLRRDFQLRFAESVLEADVRVAVLAESMAQAQWGAY